MDPESLLHTSPDVYEAVAPFAFIAICVLALAYRITKDQITKHLKPKSKSS